MDANISKDRTPSPSPSPVSTGQTMEGLPDLDVTVESRYGSAVDQGKSVLNATIDLTVETFTRTYVRGAIDLTGVESQELSGGGANKNDNIQNEGLTPKKRKLPLVIDESSPKVVRLQCSVSSKPIVYPSVLPCTNAHPNPHLNILSSNHTITSADFDGELEPRVRIFQDDNGLPSGVVSLGHANNMGNLPMLQTNTNPPLIDRQSFVTSAEMPMSCPLLNDKPISTTQQLKMVTDSSKPPHNNSTSQTLPHPTQYYQIIEMFPDIDEYFVSEHCNQEFELSLEEIIELILSMNNDYPKKKQYVLPPKKTFRPVSPYYCDLNHLSNVQNLHGAQTNPIAPENNASVATNPVHFETGDLVVSRNDNNSNRQTCESVPVLNSGTGQGDSPQNVPSSEGPSLPVVGKAIRNGINEEHNKQFDFLLGLFPDADPSFLETKSKLKDDELKNFISETLEKANYPKVTFKSEKQEPQVNCEQKTTSLSIEKFLELFPDPFKHFSNDARVCVDYGQYASEFMKNRYRFHSIKFIRTTYKQLNFNLAKTCEKLKTTQATRTTKRSKQETYMHDLNSVQPPLPLPFLQEVWFIEHEDEIKAHVDGITESQRLAYEQAEQKGELIECGCCYSNVLFEECATCIEGDLFCKTCVRRSSEIRVSEGFTTFPCLLDCGASFSLQVLQTLLGARMFSRLLQRIQTDEVRAANIEGLEVCPFCEFATIPPPETNIFTCLNPDCLKESCRKCHKVNHIPLRCEEVENDDQARARKYIEDEMTKALVRECYHCKKSFIKLDGCNKMTCTCGARMCYICRQPVKDYKHFNGPNGSETQKCPLFSTEKLLHVDAVHEVAKRALEAISASDPQLKLKHDPTKLLPSPSKATKTLPPGVVERPAELLAQLGGHQQQPVNMFVQHIHGRRGPIIFIPPAPLPRPPPQVPVQRNNFQFAGDGRAIAADAVNRWHTHNQAAATNNNRVPAAHHHNAH